MKRCAFPSCNASLEGRPKCTVWCKECALAMKRSRGRRIEARKFRKSRSPYEHCVHKTRRRSDEEPREPQILCKHCFGLPWARTPERRNERTGGHAMPDVPVADADGLCRGCRLPYAPEPEPEQKELLRSSAGRAADHGTMYGG